MREHWPPHVKTAAESHAMGQHDQLPRAMRCDHVLIISPTLFTSGDSGPNLSFPPSPCTTATLDDDICLLVSVLLLLRLGGPRPPLLSSSLTPTQNVIHPSRLGLVPALLRSFPPAIFRIIYLLSPLWALALYLPSLIILFVWWVDIRTSVYPIKV